MLVMRRLSFYTSICLKQRYRKITKWAPVQRKVNSVRKAGKSEPWLSESAPLCSLLLTTSSLPFCAETLRWLLSCVGYPRVTPVSWFCWSSPPTLVSASPLLLSCAVLLVCCLLFWKDSVLNGYWVIDCSYWDYVLICGNTFSVSKQVIVWLLSLGQWNIIVDFLALGCFLNF